MPMPRIILVLVLAVVVGAFGGCPGAPTATTHKLHITVTAPFPGCDFSQLIISPVSNPNAINQTGSLHLIEGNVLVVSGLTQGENYNLSLFVAAPGALSWIITGQTGVVADDVHWLIYENAGGGLETLVNALPTLRTLQS